MEIEDYIKIFKTFIEKEQIDIYYNEKNLKTHNFVLETGEYLVCKDCNSILYLSYRGIRVISNNFSYPGLEAPTCETVIIRDVVE